MFHFTAHVVQIPINMISGYYILFPHLVNFLNILICILISTKCWCLNNFSVRQPHVLHSVIWRVWNTDVKNSFGVPVVAQWLTNPTRNHEVLGSIPGLAQWIKDPAVSCGVGCRCSLDPELLWLWCRLVVTAPIRPLAWEPPHAAGAAPEKAKRPKKKKKKEKKRRIWKDSRIWKL